MSIENVYAMKKSPIVQFGKYLILRQLARGGMAEIYLARPASANANGRILILKRILPQIMLDSGLIRMFQSEIKVSMGFNHPNLVQIFDFGKFDSNHYIAMEYIEGKTLRELTIKFRKLQQTLPISAAVNIAAQAAAGLHYAHNYKNHVTNETLNVIHRDISPQNILVSYDGIVKIIDFGIAQSDRKSVDKTQTGFIKGKLSYLSPEQLFQKSLDGRSDLFSLGAVLWELLTNQKLFPHKGRSDMEIMQSIADCDNILPPSTFNLKVPVMLDQIVMRALAKDRENRYSSAEKMAADLNQFLESSDPLFKQVQFGNLLKEVFQRELELERETLKDLNQEAQILLEEWEKNPESGGSPANIQTLAPFSNSPFHQSSPYLLSGGSFEGPPSLDPSLPSRVREQFYVKLTIPRAIGLLVYAATLLILRLDHNQIVLNAIFGGWNAPTQAPSTNQQASRGVAGVQAAAIKNANDESTSGFLSRDKTNSKLKKVTAASDEVDSIKRPNRKRNIRK